MKHLRLYMIIFCTLVSLPLAFVAWRTYGALDREVQAQMRFFSERLLDEIEAELADLVRREESRAVDEYGHTRVQESGTTLSPLTRLPDQAFILGYFQNNPDGSFQTPLVEEGQELPAGLVERVKQLHRKRVKNRQQLQKKNNPALPTFFCGHPSERSPKASSARIAPGWRRSPQARR